MKTDLQTIVKANNIMLEKLTELKNCFSVTPLKDSKEETKYYRLNESESAKAFKQSYLKATEDFKNKLNLEINNLNNTNYTNFVKKLVNNYAKVEDEYFVLLNASKTTEMTASLMFKCECKLNYLMENLNTVNKDVELLENDNNLEK